MKIFNALLLLLFYLNASAQSTVKGTISSSLNHQPVPYASVHLIGTKNILDANENGYFEIAGSTSDSLLITSIGYNDSTIAITRLKNNDTVFLREKLVALQEVLIGKSHIETFGILNEKFGSSRDGGSLTGRSELTTLIQIPDSVNMFRINKVFIKGKRYNEDNPIRLHIYAVNEYGLPGQELLAKSVIITKENFHDGVIEVNLKDQNIILEHVLFFVGVQWITDKNVKWPTGPEIVQTAKVPKIISYYRETNLNNNMWYAGNFQTMIVYPDGKKPGIGGPLKSNPLNMCASAEVEVYELTQTKQ